MKNLGVDFTEIESIILKMSEIPYEPSGICQCCNKRKATCAFSEGSIAMIHGFYEQICELCMTKRQLKHAEEMVVSIEKLKSRLTLLESELPELSERELADITPKYIFRDTILNYIGLQNVSGTVSSDEGTTGA
jgi:hypothetical protein